MMTPTHLSWIFDDSDIPDPLDYGKRNVEWVRRLRHPKSRLPGRAFQLDPWFERIMLAMYGPRHLVDDPENGIRRGDRIVTTLMNLIPRGNRKTTYSAALALLHTIGPERTPGGEALLAASDRRQAKIAFQEAAGIINLMDRKSRQRIRVVDSRNRIMFPEIGSWLEAVSSDAGRQHGRTPAFVLMDELHAWRGHALWEALTSGADKSDNTLTVIATTAGRGRENLCWEKLEHARKVARREVVDPTFLPVLFEAPADCNWRDEEVWRAVNPGMSCDPPYPSLAGFRRAAARAEQSPAELDSFKLLKLNIWQDRFTSGAFDMAIYDANEAGKEPINFTGLKGAACWIGVDLSRKGDLTAVIAVFKVGDEFAVLPHIFVPKDGLAERSLKDEASYTAWVKDGHMTACPGPTIDFGQVEDTISGLCDTYDVKEILFDATYAGEMMASLRSAGHNAIRFDQGWHQMGPATGDLIKIVTDKKLRHGNNPALRWTFENATTVRSDRTGNDAFHKGHSRARIDPVVATAMALARARRPVVLSAWEDPSISIEDLISD